MLESWCLPERKENWQTFGPGNDPIVPVCVAMPHRQTDRHGRQGIRHLPHHPSSSIPSPLSLPSSLTHFDFSSLPLPLPFSLTHAHFTFFLLLLFAALGNRTGSGDRQMRGGMETGGTGQVLTHTPLLCTFWLDEVGMGWDWMGWLQRQASPSMPATLPPSTMPLPPSLSPFLPCLPCACLSPWPCLLPACLPPTLPFCLPSHAFFSCSLPHALQATLPFSPATLAVIRTFTGRDRTGGRAGEAEDGRRKKEKKAGESLLGGQRRRRKEEDLLPPLDLLPHACISIYPHHPHPHPTFRHEHALDLKPCIARL